MSLHLESYTGLQHQLFRSAELFDAPELGAVPLFLTMAIPGAAHIDHKKPVAVHLIGKKTVPGVVIEVAPVGTTDAYIRAVLGKDPDETRTIHPFNGGAITAVNGRLRISPYPEYLEALEKEGLTTLPAAPDIPGTIKIIAFPAAAQPWFKNLETTILTYLSPSLKDYPHDDSTSIDLYQSIAEQVKSLTLGIATDDRGLLLHSGIEAVPGTDVAALIASRPPLPPQLLNFRNKNEVFWIAGSGYTMPPTLAEQTAAAHAARLAAKYQLAVPENEEPIDFSTITSLLMAGQAAPFSLSLDIALNALQARGIVMINNPQARYEDYIAAISTLPVTALLKDIGLQIETAAPRKYGSTTIRRHLSLFNDELFRKNRENRIPPTTKRKKAVAEIAHQANLKKSLNALVSTGCECAAVADALVFGTGSPAMIESAVDHLNSATTLQISQNTRNLLERLTLENTPCTVGEIVLSDIIIKLAHHTPETDKQALSAHTSGEAIIFAEWTKPNAINALTIIPPAEVKALRKIVQSQLINTPFTTTTTTEDQPITSPAPVEPNDDDQTETHIITPQPVAEEPAENNQ
jgi:hypothetical protein